MNITHSMLGLCRIITLRIGRQGAGIWVKRRLLLPSHQLPDGAYSGGSAFSMQELNCTAHKMKLNSMQLPYRISRVYSGPLMTVPYKIQAARILIHCERFIELAIPQEGNSAEAKSILRLDGRTSHHQHNDHRRRNTHHRQKSIAEPMVPCGA